MSQAYHRPPSDIYGVKGAVGLFFDRGIRLFGQHVEGEVQRAGSDAISPGFARSAQQRAFARCMGEDMEKSNIGFADPAVTGALSADGDQILDAGY
jgi:hypothetical protein